MNIVLKHPDFDPQFPEEFNWELVDTHSLALVGSELAHKVQNDLSLPPDERFRIPGMRIALNEIAKIALL